jgi:leader peptidase (prepilin peptidase)/N-methyltransferase
LTVWLLIAFVYGIVIGSFLNVVIWRLPRGGSIASPTWSYCPRCEHRLGAIDLVPVFSYLFLRAKCRYCKARISYRYPAIELLNGLLFTAVAWKFAGNANTAYALNDSICYCAFVAILVCVFFIDLEHFVIPDSLSVLGALIGFAHNGINIALQRPGQWVSIGPVSVPASVVGFAGYAAIIYGIGLLSAVWLIGVMDKRRKVLVVAREYICENAADWLWIAVYYLSSVISPLRRFVEPPVPLEGSTAQEIEADEDAGGMGGGDGKLAAAIGATLFFTLACWSLVLAIGCTILATGIVFIVQRRKLGGRTPVPFGPGMVVGAIIAMFFGTEIVSWYIRTFWTFPGSPFVPDASGISCAFGILLTHLIIK